MGTYTPPMSAASLALDHTPLTFGKYIGQTPDEISENNPGYIVWLYDTVKNKPTCSKTLRDSCQTDSFYAKKEKAEEFKPLDPLNDLEF